jgi:hypothetical protein
LVEGFVFTAFGGEEAMEMGWFVAEWGGSGLERGLGEDLGFLDAGAVLLGKG